MINKIKKLVKSRKFKLGSVSLAFAAAIVVIILLLNAIVSVFDAKNGLYIDTTGENRYDIGEKTMEVLSDVDEEIIIYFFADKDVLMQNSTASNMIVTLAEKYTTTFDNISVEYLDLNRNFSKVTSLAALAGADPTVYKSRGKILGSDIIVMAKASNRARIIRPDAFFRTDTNGYYAAFDGEARFTNSILMTVNTSEDKVVFITGHREKTEPTELKRILMDQGYNASSILTVNLTTDDIPEGTRLVIINNPELDYKGFQAETKGEINEIKKLENYINKSYGNLFVTIGKDSKNLPTLKSFIEAYGISFTSGAYVEDGKISEPGNPDMIKPLYYTSGDDAAYSASIVKELGANEIVMEACVPLEKHGSVNRIVAPILTSSDDAKIYYEGESRSAKYVPLMMISTYFDYPFDENGKQAVDPSYSHIIVSGSSDFFNDIDTTNKNEKLVKNVLRLTGTKTITVEGIDYKLFNDTTLPTITSKKAQTMTLVITFVPALVISIIGIAVYIRRKRL